MADYQILVVEDDPTESKRLSGYIARYASEHGEGLSVTCYDTAVDLVSQERTFDLVFLDIGLPGISGMEAAHLLRAYDQVTPIIFVTDLAQYAVKGYEVDALDFMVKPVSYYAFSMRMDKAMRHIKRSARRSIALTMPDGLRTVPVDDLVSVEITNHTLVYHVSGEPEPLRVRGSLAAVEKDLEGGPFVRISNSCLANMNHVATVHGGDLTMSDGTQLFCSRSKKRAALETIANYLGGSI
ncbi:MAG: LytTR family DNA-binding domain-containing protein [Atopobiaceae bacterium]|jgi:DNA-binding LytR/AlgR family response regulator|nr:LytTR family DNA-binding domain-containing protein [Atopobiaceae bacterium]MCH4181405.1 LytTR family DNA-binding domain-containing protein [Atopobiaceae bacterium]MCH4214833.1 LytTR family DNA-binding domain-containing protein [Atopobiaceae bacterium]MCH4230216.1 LytTR family DNA-binding domain-containing protein [Atopobiaceae bacterium]MCH4276955.1 LytTR family DNA-binding domain-containing protein [Atopobiaceae bacterium]